MIAHEWHTGVMLPSGARLSTCARCEALRVVEGDRLTVIRRRVSARVVEGDEGTCEPPAVRFVAPW